MHELLLAGVFLVKIMKIHELQKWVSADWEQYPKNKPNTQQQVMLIVEEMGEVAEAIRKIEGQKDRMDEEANIGAEIADLIVSIVTLANTYDVDLSSEIEEFKARLIERHNQGY